MRTDKEMMDIILDTARDDECIRTVIMNGSRANPNAKQDPFQDYDIVYFVTDITPYIHNLEWVKRFGEIMIMQTPNLPYANRCHFTFLMQFTDGNRIDLNIHDLSKSDGLEYDSLSIVLLDKDGMIPSLPPPNESSYLPTPPSAQSYLDCCNEFWWVSVYVAKGLWREEIPYAKGLMDQVIREQLMMMLTWYAGMKSGYAINIGKFGKNLKSCLEPEVWDELMKTYSDAKIDRTWCALETFCVLFRKIAVRVAEQFGYAYPYDDDRRVFTHLRHVRNLPRDAKEIY